MTTSVCGALVELADTLGDRYDVVSHLDRLVVLSVELLAADAAGVVLVDAHERPRLVASSGHPGELAELVHQHGDRAPWLECHRQGRQVSVADLTEAGDRWPRFTEAVARRGTFRSAHALPLRLRDRAVGALLLLTTQPRAMRPAELLVGQSLADVATIGILQARTIRRAEALAEQVQAPVDGRLVIEQAKGVVRQHSNLTLDSALDRLRRYALARNLRPSQVARDIVEGRLDPAALTSALMRNNRT